MEKKSCYLKSLNLLQYNIFVLYFIFKKALYFSRLTNGYRQMLNTLMLKDLKCKIKLIYFSEYYYLATVCARSLDPSL